MGPVGLPRRNLGRFVSSFVSSEDWFAGALAGGASFCVDFFWSVVLSSFFASGLGVLGEDAGGLVEVGAAGVAAGFDPAGEGVVDVVEGGAELDVVSLFVKRGGASVPAANHAPVASHGTSALAARLCSALLTVNRPIDTPVFSPSYTIPDSSAMGTGS